MKKNIKLLMIMFLVIFAFGCSKDINKKNDIKNAVRNGTASAKDTSKQNSQNSLTVNKIEFEDITNGDIPANLNNSISILKSNRGYILYEYNDKYYIAIFSGKKNTGGYSIKVTSVEENEGKTNILIEEKSPNQGDIVTEAITSPYTVIKVMKITPDIIVKSKSGEIFEKVLSQDQMY